MSKPFQQTSTIVSPKTTFTIGGVLYSIEVSKIPYLSSFVNFEAKARPQTTDFVHEAIPLFNVALKGIESGYRQCFRSLPPDLSQHHTLCETYELLCVDVLGGQSNDEIFKDLKTGQTDYEHAYGRYREIRGDKSKARDTALKLLYLILLGDFKDETRDSAKVFNAVLYLVSHAATFKWRTRKVIRAAYEERFVVSAKQTARLDEWENKDATKLALEDEDDMTTEVEEWEPCYDSDCSD